MGEPMGTEAAVRRNSGFHAASCYHHLQLPLTVASQWKNIGRGGGNRRFRSHHFFLLTVTSLAAGSPTCKSFHACHCHLWSTWVTQWEAVAAAMVLVVKKLSFFPATLGTIRCLVQFGALGNHLGLPSRWATLGNLQVQRSCVFEYQLLETWMGRTKTFGNRVLFGSTLDPHHPY